MTLPRLKPCPFCLCYPELIVTAGDAWMVRCEADECFANPSVWSDSITDAAEQWNARRSKPRTTKKPKPKIEIKP